MEKLFITAQELLEDSFRLAVCIHESGFEPELIIGIWRGGTPIGIAVHEYFEYKGIHTDHIAIRAKSYTGINSRTEDVEITGLDYIYDHTGKDDKLLIIDDVFDSGNSFKTIIEKLEGNYGNAIVKRTKIACPWFKPGNNKTNIIPDYYLNETDKWLVFPHELADLTEAEIDKGKSVISSIVK